jgi:hypothetical protein
MATQREGAARVGGGPHHTVTLTPQARRLLEGPVPAPLLRLAAPRVFRPRGRLPRGRVFTRHAQ